MSITLERQIFDALQSSYLKNEIDCEVLEPTSQVPSDTMITLFDEIGDRSEVVRLECNFFPEQESKSEVMILQSFAALSDRAIPYHQPEILRLLAVINHTLPLGAFGLIESSNLVYFKHNTMLMKELGVERAVRQVDAQNGLILHMFQLYFDAIIDVAQGTISCDDALAGLGIESINLKKFNQ